MFLLYADMVDNVYLIYGVAATPGGCRISSIACQYNFDS